MKKEEKLTFDEVFEQNERRIHYHMLKLGIKDPHREFYVEGIYAMWMAYKKYNPNKGPLGTYFNYIIRNRLIDMLRQKTREDHNQSKITHKEICEVDNGNSCGEAKTPVIDTSGVTLPDCEFWHSVKEMLTENQWKWVKFYIIEGIPLQEIAQQEGVSEDAVKSWGRQTRRKLKGEKEVLVRLYK
ncbi:RNA polymerase sigma factor, sigma-70 family [Virgibacillus subterraneus]|uniref:RNA polymerase sigma factor, sigma-70 family n=1 Tax=Virgibacillus subterraneus TaxID=621109 RepID=A0A1H9GB23_9BACI|nr:sigma-70 family RNA polymerase sigma factor [Virgibacillus subterraneus]SEQ47260.1 RNA polymerase sigma factor, sigma-70 family [Virgibacillus subterraneus]